EQREQIELTFQHVHDDYVEIAATTGLVGITVALCSLISGYVLLQRMTFGRDSEDLAWSRRAYQAAALASVTIAMVHALVDFNLFVAANPPTLAAIAG